MSKDQDRAMTLVAVYDWCGCLIVDDVTAHLCGILCGLGVSKEVDLTNPGEPTFADWLDAPAGYEG